METIKKQIAKLEEILNNKGHNESIHNEARGKLKSLKQELATLESLKADGEKPTPSVNAEVKIEQKAADKVIDKIEKEAEHKEAVAEKKISSVEDQIKLLERVSENKALSETTRNEAKSKINVLKNGIEKLEDVASLTPKEAIKVEAKLTEQIKAAEKIVDKAEEKIEEVKAEAKAEKKKKVVVKKAKAIVHRMKKKKVVKAKSTKVKVKVKAKGKKIVAKKKRAISDREKYAIKVHEKMAKQKAKGKTIAKKRKTFVLVKDSKGNRHKVVVKKGNLKNYSKSIRRAYMKQQTVDVIRDKGRLGLPPGKRISRKHYSNKAGDHGKLVAGGHKYYEYRLGHGDKSAKLRLEEGGQLKPLTKKQKAIKYIKGLTDINTFTDPNSKYEKTQAFINHSLNVLDHLLMNAHLVLPHVTTLVRFKDGGIAEETIVIPKELVREIEGFVKSGYNRVVGGWVTDQRKALMLVNDKGETMGVYPLQMEEILEQIIANPDAKYADGGEVGNTVADYLRIYNEDGKVYFQAEDDTFFDVENALEEVGANYGTTNITPADQWIYNADIFDSGLRYLKPQGSEETQDELSNMYYLIVDMDERGEYGATVYNSKDEQVWDIDTEGLADLIEFGYLKYKPDEDLERLSKYLSDNNILQKDASVVSERYFNELKDKTEEYKRGGVVDDLHLQEVRLEEELRVYRADLKDASKKEKENLKGIIADTEDDLRIVRQRIDEHYKKYSGGGRADNKVWGLEVQKTPNGQWEQLSTKLTREEAENMKREYENSGVAYHKLLMDYPLFKDGGSTGSEEWVVYNGDGHKLISTHKDSKSAKLAMKKLFNTGEFESIGSEPKSEWEKMNKLYYPTRKDGGSVGNDTFNLDVKKTPNGEWERVNKHPLTYKEAETMLLEYEKSGIQHFLLRIKNTLYKEGGEVGEHKYKLGDKWRSDFDTYGMLEMGAKANVSWGIPKLEKLFKSYKSVNYDQIAGKPLWAAIQLMKEGKNKEAEVKMLEFNKLSSDESLDETGGMAFENGYVYRIIYQKNDGKLSDEVYGDELFAESEEDLRKEFMEKHPNRVILSVSKIYKRGGALTEREKVDSLVGKRVAYHSLGVTNPFYERIVSASLTPEHFVHRDVVFRTKNGQDHMPLEKLDKFLNLEEVTLKDSQGEPYVIKLSDK